MKDKEFIKEKSNDMTSNSYKEFGIHNFLVKLNYQEFMKRKQKLKGSTMMTQRQP